ncbi:inverse autotransporter beta domain-containing protein [Xenorhabdus sp. XENO-10]|uniref:Inverse autotransporter beta domain-containing protein n=1 Tax=Xenorhabdus yunnanensis TaxID=3025878 RepID=A0ABT5LIQ4_9GAMM|nr:inverse autotransporter beta domain-containing protein [Xenorhabdus yunnanensis]MDC9590368.1 inverse autotransporter beta domain-containing protein [Xenorhabdus yunnanensis]
MDSYISKKFVRFLVFIYSIVIFPLTSLSAFAVGGEKHEHQSQKRFLENQENENNLNDNDKGNETAGLIARNIQTVSNVLSSSPSELTEQAKSYALGKINSTVNGEAQKWLSQFGTAKINFSMDRKGKLDNGSLDLLLPLYDNKSDWLFFSQLGYRNKDSRHTLNLGFGGRYFTPSWMYGLNSFYDFDVTGNNKRIGLGGEAWTDYAKFSANTYWRVSDWHDSPHEKGWEERPANGFDINGEFFLPVYPNIGGKLAYEQYFGDQVALFNRDTKQKDPSLARFGVNYTPVPLVTMGVDYKLGSGGHSETLFQTNLNYRFGVPFEAQLSSDNVASMRTLAGSRHDLVERNNQIVLDYRKKGEKEVLLNIQQQNITGYSYQRWAPIHATVTPKDAKLKWQPDDLFSENNGGITENMNPIGLTLPKYNPKTDNTYVLSFTAEDSSGNKSKPSDINVKVEPFVLKEDVTKEVVKSGKPGEVAYKLLATITYGTKDNDPLTKLKMSKLEWSVNEPNTDKVKWVQSDTTNDKGQLEATVSSDQPLKNVEVYLTMDGMPQAKVINDLDFAKVVESEYTVKIETKEKSPLEANKNSGYIFIATVTDAAGHLLKEKDVTVEWSVKNDLPPGVKWLNEKKTDKTDENGQISATLVSEKAATGIIAGVSIDGAKPVYMTDPVAFEEKNPLTKDITWTGAQEYEAVRDKQRVVTVNIPDITKFNPNYTYNINFDKDKYPGLKSVIVSAPATLKNKITFTFESTQITEPGTIELTLTELGSNKKINISSPPISFKAGLNKIQVSKFEEVDGAKRYKANGNDKVKLKINVNYSAGDPAKNLSIDPSKIEWSTNVVEELKDKYTFTPESPTTTGNGELYVYMTSKVSIRDENGIGIKPKIKLPTSEAGGGQEVGLSDNGSIIFDPVPKLAQLRVFNKDDPNKDNPTTQHTYGINEHGPSNVFNSLQAYLLDGSGKRLPANSSDFEVTYTDDEKASFSKHFIDKDSGLISFNTVPSEKLQYEVLHDRTFKATVRNTTTFENIEYEYYWKPVNWFLLMGYPDSAIAQDSRRHCTESGIKEVHKLDVWNYDGRGGSKALLTEFGGNVVKLGFFTVPIKTSYSTDNSIITVLNADSNKFEPLDLSDVNNDKINKNTSASVVCLIDNRY